MPIDVNSEKWKNGKTYDPIRVEIENLLFNNREQAFSITEIEEYILENHQQLFPHHLIGDDAVDGAKAARQAILATVLDDEFWHSRVAFRHISDDSEAEVGLYFTWEGNGINPIAEVDEVKDPDPESPLMTLETRFRHIEGDIEDEVAELHERISNLEYRLRDELDFY